MTGVQTCALPISFGKAQVYVYPRLKNTQVIEARAIVDSQSGKISIKEKLEKIAAGNPAVIFTGRLEGDELYAFFGYSLFAVGRAWVSVSGSISCQKK